VADPERAAGLTFVLLPGALNLQTLNEVATGLATGVVAFLLGLLWQHMRKAFLNYRARRFWRPVMSRDLQLVLGRFRGLPGFEASGVIGAGDTLAMNNLREYFEKIGFGGFQVSLNDQLGYGDPTGDSLRTNLILLGGPDANRLTYDVVKLLKLGIVFKELDPRRPGELLEPRIYDMSETNGQGPVRRALRLFGLLSGEQWRTPVIADLDGSKKVFKPTKTGDAVLVDCGVIIRTPNPFDLTKSIIILCGSYGYGTWAAVQLAQSKEFIRRIPKGSGALECVFEVDVVRDTPQRPHIHFIRETPKSPAIP
jgi:hypothetical protein